MHHGHPLLVEQLNDDLGYQSIAEWDSFAHVQLMLTLEDEFGLAMTNDLMLELDSVRAIKSCIERKRANGSAGNAPPQSTPCQHRAPAPAAVHRGLTGIHFDNSTITHIDGERGRLEYRGYDVDELAEHATFEEAAWLLLHGELPTRPQLSKFSDELGAARTLPTSVLNLLDIMKGAHPMDALRTAVSALGASADDAATGDPAAAMRAGITLMAQVPTVIATHHAVRNGRTPCQPRPDLPLAHDFLRMLIGGEPAPELVRIIDQDLIVHADHGSNASAFAARVAIGCGVGPYAAVTAALAAFAGPLHGGAVESAMRQLDKIDGPGSAASFVRELQHRNQPVMGFGHRVYRTEDPRVRHFRKTARDMSERCGATRTFETLEALVEAMQPYARLGIGANVDLYAGLTYRLMGLPDDLATAIFAAGRMPGWIAQALEQQSNNILIRPLLNYVGASSRPYPARSDIGATPSGAKAT